MLLLWLLLLPTARAAIECHSACGLCAMDPNPASAACNICRECHKVHKENLMLSNNQDHELKAMERKEFKQVLKEYGWVPEDLVDTKIKLQQEGEEEREEEEGEEDGEYEEGEGEYGEGEGEEEEHDHHCLPPPSYCINDEESSDRKLAHKVTPKCPTLPPKNCPHVKPRKKMLVKKKRTPKVPSPPSTLSTVPIVILKHIVTLKQDDDDCVTQPPVSDSEHVEGLSYEEVTPTKPACPPDVKKLTKKLTKKTTKSPTTATTCVPCMPLCQLPCGGPAQNVLPSIPPEALEALMTLKPLEKKLSFTTQSIEERIDTEISKAFIEDTTKDYVYLYVGIPKDVKPGRHG